MSGAREYIWEGIAARFPSQASGDVFNSTRWVQSQKKNAAQKIKSLRRVSEDHPDSLVHEYPLCPVAAVASVGKAGKKRIRILDFGGGLDGSFFPLKACLPANTTVDYHVVETDAICREGRRTFRGVRGLRFHTKFPSRSQSFDIVHAGSSLHYVEDWKSVLNKFAGYKPRFILLSGLMAGGIKTFVTFQNYYGTKIPVWFWNEQEVIKAMQRRGYRLIYRSLLASLYKGKRQALPMKNFPPARRLKRKCNLLFVRN